jgi:hypothetical protein
MNDIILSPISKAELFKFIDVAVTKAMLNFKEPDLNDELITRAELKSYVGIASDTTVIRLEKIGVFSPIRIGRRMFYRKGDVKKAIHKLKRDNNV